MRILVDLDDTVVDMMTKACYYMRKIYGSNVRIGDLKQWDLPDIEMWRSIWKHPGFFADLPWMRDAKWALTMLADQGHELVIVSSPVVWPSCPSKMQWCHTHLRIPGIIQSMNQVMLSSGKHRVMGDVIIDDNPAYLEHPTATPICFARPWNRDYQGIRCSGWEEVYLELQRIAKWPVPHASGRASCT